MAHILVADDEIEQIKIERCLLEMMGYEVSTALSPAETLREIERKRPDLIVVDLRFPRASEGLALIRGIRQRDSETPVIVVSGWPDDLYGAPEVSLVSRIVVKGSVRELLHAIAELLPVKSR
ncbi:MAG TPA: response regulator [Verrucomicrobiae bacterium]|nr:response regulator [Verrucomicrobiae bacterium]